MKTAGITLIILCGVGAITLPTAYPMTDNLIVIVNSSIPVFVEPSICISSITGNVQHVDCGGQFIQIREGTLITDMLHEIQRLEGIIDSFVSSLMAIVQEGNIRGLD